MKSVLLIVAFMLFAFAKRVEIPENIPSYQCPYNSGVAKPRHTWARAQATFACALAFPCHRFKLAPHLTIH